MKKKMIKGILKINTRVTFRTTRLRRGKAVFKTNVEIIGV